jgi:hypothetical protein
MKKRNNKGRRQSFKNQLCDAWELLRKNDKFYSFIVIVAQEIVLHYFKSR